MSAASLPAAKFEGSRILRDWNEQRARERALHQRSRQQLRSQGFAGAQISRLTASLSQWSGSVNADLDLGLVPLRSRARSLCANNEFAKRFLGLVATNIVGPFGPTLQVRAVLADGKTLDKAGNDVIERHWRRWSRTAELTGRMNLARALAVIVRSVARDGEALVRIVRDRALPYGMALQLLEADRLDEGMNQRLSNGNSVRMGVELTAAGRPVAYWVRTAHPGDPYTTQHGGVNYERVPAGDLVHLFLPDRAEQVRGYSWFHAILLRAHLLHGFDEAAVVAARVGASKMFFIRRSEDADPNALGQMASGEDAATGALQMTAEPGEGVPLPAGYDITPFTPDYPHANYESFHKACVRGLAVGLEVANHNLGGDMTQVNYSSARIAEMSERDVWMALQEWLIDGLLVPVYREWLNIAMLRGDIVFPSGSILSKTVYEKFADAGLFLGRRWAWVDPLNDAKASRELFDMFLISRTQLAAQQGRAFDDVVAEIQAEEDLLSAAGLARAAAAGAPRDKDKPEKEAS